VGQVYVERGYERTPARIGPDPTPIHKFATPASFYGVEFVFSKFGCPCSHFHL
jgi:hypothetical protein